MTRPVTGAAHQRVATASATLSALSALARKDAFLSLVDRAGDSRQVMVGGGASGDGAGGRTVSYTVFRAALDAGWLRADPDRPGRWVLSTPGRTLLRRLRSAGSESVAALVDKGAALAERPTAPHDVADVESPLAWLRNRRDKSGRPMLTDAQWSAGERLRNDIHFAALGPRITTNWTAAGGGRGNSQADLLDGVAGARQRIARAMAAVGAIAAGLLFDVCGHLQGLEQVERARGWPARSGKIALQMALSALARHYGIPDDEAGGPASAGRLHHWGAEGYRPSSGGAETERAADGQPG